MTLRPPAIFCGYERYRRTLGRLITNNHGGHVWRSVTGDHAATIDKARAPARGGPAARHEPPANHRNRARRWLGLVELRPQSSAPSSEYRRADFASACARAWAYERNLASGNRRLRHGSIVALYRDLPRTRGEVEDKGN